ncbi:MAG: hypothetical protein QOJ51_1358 [Acidobacteriaceae bacterium]|jgi:hypothetical protein|nr:hypothetical protein [Acidobacteriaceae bacterium]MEA2258533.1 hypothetical protein [Acidobacteriaceae bacterium]
MMRARFSFFCWDGGSTIGALVWCAHSATAWFHEHTSIQMGSCIKRHGFGAEGEVRTTSVRRLQHAHTADPPVIAALVITKEPFCPLIASALFSLTVSRKGIWLLYAAAASMSDYKLTRREVLARISAAAALRQLRTLTIVDHRAFALLTR